MTTKIYTGAELLALAAESAYDDGQWLARAVGNFNRIISRGDGIAVYENAEIGHPEAGHRKYVSYGGTPEAQLAGFTPPQRLPDFPSEINWRYQLAGMCREPVPAPPPVTEVLGVPVNMEPVLLHYRVALDNYEPMPRVIGYGRIVRYIARDGVTAWKLFPDDEGRMDLGKGVFLVDDGVSVTAAYVAGWPAAGDGDPYVLLFPFPVNPDGKRTPDGRRVIDHGTWMVGPRRAYHLKVSPP